MSKVTNLLEWKQDKETGLTNQEIRDIDEHYETTMPTVKKGDRIYTRMALELAHYYMGAIRDHRDRLHNIIPKIDQ